MTKTETISCFLKKAKNCLWRRASCDQ